MNKLLIMILLLATSMVSLNATEVLVTSKFGTKKSLYVFEKSAISFEDAEKQELLKGDSEIFYFSGSITVFDEDDNRGKKIRVFNSYSQRILALKYDMLAVDSNGCAKAKFTVESAPFSKDGDEYVIAYKVVNIECVSSDKDSSLMGKLGRSGLSKHEFMLLMFGGR